MKYIFLSYINRSGSTFLVNQFSKQELFCVCPEADILYNFLLRKPQKVNAFKRKHINQFLIDKKLIQWQLAHEKIERILLLRTSHGEKFLKILELFRDTHFPSSKYILFKYNFIIQLKSFFEKKTLSDTFHWIYLQRNPLSVYASQKQSVSPTTSKLMTTNVVLFCQKVKFLESLCNSSGTERYLKIFYEDLMENFNSTFSALFSFLDVSVPFVMYNSSQGKLRPYMTEEFNALHPYIDSPPDIHRLTAWVSSLSEYETYYICQKLNLPVPGETVESAFRIKFISPFISDTIKSYFINIKEWVHNILDCT